MSMANVNGVSLYYELHNGDGIPLVLVHGSWTSHHTWDRVAPRLAESFRVLTYDRRGHSRSERPTAQGSIQGDVDDLAALIEQLDLAPAWVVGSSFGGNITLRLAGKRPDLFRGLAAHEPAPLFSLIADNPDFAAILDELAQKERAVAERIAGGDHDGAAQEFVDRIALGPGSWEQMPPAFQQMITENAPTFLDELSDDERNEFDLERVRDFSQPALLTMGDQSPPFYAPIIAKIAQAMPKVECATFARAGHIPYNTHPDDYVEVVGTFVEKHSA